MSIEIKIFFTQNSLFECEYFSTAQFDIFNYDDRLGSS